MSGQPLARSRQSPVRRIAALLIVSAVVFLAVWLMAFSLVTSLLVASGCCVVIAGASAVFDAVELVLDIIAAIVFGIFAAIAAVFAAIAGLFS